MSERMCLDGKVRVVFGVGPMPRPDSSHPVQWIRRRDHRRSLAFIEGRPVWRVDPPQRGVITVSIQFELLHLYVPSEMRAAPAALARIIRHERGHVPAWEQALSSHVDDLCTALESQITGTATVQAVHDIVQSLQRQRSRALTQAATAWDRRDYPGLFRDLERMGAPRL